MTKDDELSDSAANSITSASSSSSAAAAGDVSRCRSSVHGSTSEINLSDAIVYLRLA